MCGSLKSTGERKEIRSVCISVFLKKIRSVQFGSKADKERHRWLHNDEKAARLFHVPSPSGRRRRLVVWSHPDLRPAVARYGIYIRDRLTSCQDPCEGAQSARICQWLSRCLAAMGLGRATWITGIQGCLVQHSG